MQRQLQAEAVEDGRHQVDMLGERRRPAAARAVRVPDHQRHVEGLREEPGLAQHPVVAQHLAVVRGDHHQRPVELAAAGQRVEDAAEMVVDLGDQARNRPRAGCARLGAVEQGAPVGARDRLRQVRREPGMQGSLGLDRGARTGAGTPSGATDEYQGSGATKGGCGLRNGHGRTRARRPCPSSQPRKRSARKAVTLSSARNGAGAPEAAAVDLRVAAPAVAALAPDSRDRPPRPPAGAARPESPAPPPHRSAATGCPRGSVRGSALVSV